MPLPFLSREAGHQIISTIILVSCLLIAQSNGETPSSEFLDHNPATVIQYKGNSNPDIAYHHQEKLTEQENYDRNKENEDIAAIAKAYEGYEETLAQEQELLLNEQYYNPADEEAENEAIDERDELEQELEEVENQQEEAEGEKEEADNQHGEAEKAEIMQEEAEDLQEGEEGMQGEAEEQQVEEGIIQEEAEDIEEKPKGEKGVQKEAESLSNEIHAEQYVAIDNYQEDNNNRQKRAEDKQNVEYKQMEDVLIEESDCDMPEQSPNNEPNKTPRKSPHNSPKERPKSIPRNKPNQAPRKPIKNRPRDKPNNSPRKPPKKPSGNSPNTEPHMIGNKDILKLPRGCDIIMKIFDKIKNKGKISRKGTTIKFHNVPRRNVYIRDFFPIRKYNNFKIRSAKFECSTYSLSISAQTASEWTIIPNYLTLRRVTVLITVQTNAPKKTLKVVMNGYWRVGNLNVKSTITFRLATKITHIVAQPRPGTSLPSFVKSITDLTLPVPSSIKVDFKFEGNIYPKGAVFLLLASDKQRNKFYAIYKKRSKRYKPVKAIAAEIQQFRLSTILYKLFDVDFSQTPVFGKFKFPNTGLIYSTGKMRIQGKKIFKRSPLLQTTKNTVNKGLTAFIRVPFHNDPLIAKYLNKVLVLTTPRRNLRLDRLLQFLLPSTVKNQITLPIPHWKRIFHLYIELVRVTPKSVTIVMSFPQPVVFFKRFLRLSKVKAEILIKKTKPKVSVKLTGNVHLAGVTFQTELARNRKHKYVLKAIGDKIHVTKLIHQFHAAILPKEVSAFLRRLPIMQMSIIRPQIFYTFGVKPMQIHIGGKPRIHGYRDVDMNLLMLKVRGKVKAAIALKLGNVNLAQVFTKITGFNFRRFFILNQQITTTITISPMKINRAHFTGKLSSLSIPKGISLIASMRFPRHCRNDKFCKFVGRLIGHNTILSLKGSILSATYYSISATLNKIKLGRGLALYKAGLEIVGGSSSRIGVVGEVHLNKPKLVFAARISVGTKGLTVQLTMSNCWHRAFGANWLDICNILGAVDFSPPTGITGLAMGAQIHLGYKSTRHQLRAKAYIGISIINPIENYYYARFNRATLLSLLRAFRINRHLPRPLRDSGFPNGFLSSFSALGKELPEVRVSIPIGFRLKGAFRILGLQGSADITIGLPRGIDIKVGLPPIKIGGGILEMYASSRDRGRGPYLKVKVQVIPRFNVHIEASGYLSVLKISREARLKITNTHYEFFIRGRVLQLFDASMHITARYGNIRHASFHVRGEFKADLFNRIKSLASGSFNKIANTAHWKLNSAHRVFEHAKRVWNNVKGAAHRAWNKLRRLGHGRRTAKIMEGCKGRSCSKIAKIGLFRKVVRHIVRHPIDALRRAREKARRHMEILKQRAKEAIRRHLEYLRRTARERTQRLKAYLRKAREKAERLRRHMDDIRRKKVNGIAHKVWSKVKRSQNDPQTAKVMKGCKGRSCRQMAKIGWARFRRIVRHVGRFGSDALRRAREKARRLKQIALRKARERARQLKEIALRRARYLENIRRRAMEAARRRMEHLRRIARERAAYLLRKAREKAERLRRHAEHLKRIAREKAERLRRHAEHLKRIAREKVMRVLSLAKHAYNKAKRVLNRATHKMNHARNHFHHVQRVFKTGLRLFNYIRRHGLGGILNIHRLRFSVSLKSAKRGHFAGEINLRFLRRRNMHFRISFNLYRINSLAKGVFDKLKNQLHRIFG